MGDIRHCLNWVRERTEYIILFLLCLGSRVLTASYEVGDPYVLKYALSIKGEGEPHGVSGFEHPLFLYAGRFFYDVSGECVLSCAVIGGIGVFLLIVFSLAITNTPIRSLEGSIITVLFFFNPFLWVMSNGLMPGLLVLALLMVALYYLLFDSHPWRQAGGLILAGLVAASSQHFMLFLAIPVMYMVFTSGLCKEYVTGLLTGIGLFLFFEHMIEGKGVSGQGMLAIAETEGAEKANVLDHLSNYLHAIWTKGLGGFAFGRSWETIVISAVVFAALVPGVVVFMRESQYPTQKKALLVSCVIYLVWSAVFNNYNDVRYILPLLPVLLIIIAYGVIYLLIHWNNLWTKAAILVFVIAYTMLSVKLVVAHRQPSAFSKVQEYIVQEGKQDVMIIAPEFVNFYLAGKGLKARFYTPEGFEKVGGGNQKQKNRLLFIGPEGFYSGMKRDTCFKNNPYLYHQYHELVVYKR